jgi:hypothetical protein
LLSGYVGYAGPFFDLGIGILDRQQQLATASQLAWYCSPTRCSYGCILPTQFSRVF